MNNKIYGGDVPMGLGMALVQNRDALKKFSDMTDSQRKKIIDGTHNIRSSEEMEVYVQGIVDGNTSIQS